MFLECKLVMELKSALHHDYLLTLLRMRFLPLN